FNNPPGAFCWRGEPYIVLYIVLLLSQRRAGRAARTSPWWRIVQLLAVTATAGVTLAGFAGPAGARTGPGGDPFGFTVNPPPGVAVSGSRSSASPTATGSDGSSQRKQLYVPELIAALSSGITSSQLAAISKMQGVQAALAGHGAKVKRNRQSGNGPGV